MSQVLILAGGAGTRLKAVTGRLPKPLATVCGNTLLGRQLEMISAQGFKDVVVLTGFGAEQIADYCGDGTKWALSVRCLSEPAPRGTAGAVIDALSELAERFVVLYGDTVLNVDLARLVAAHQRRSAAATIFLHPNDHPFDSDIVEIDGEGYIRALHPYPHTPGKLIPNLVNAALYVIERKALEGLNDLPERPDFVKHVFPRMLASGLRLFGYCSPEYIKDAGTPERLAKVAWDVETGRVESLSFKTSAPAIFLDRDGVLNDNHGYVTKPEELRLFPGVGGAVARINHSCYRSVVITNQPVVARGGCTMEELAAIHAKLDFLLAEDQAYIDRLYYCPHHPDRGYPGEVAELKLACSCRKPETGLIDRAVQDLGVSIGGSWMIGDATSDMEFARRCGMRFMLVRTGLSGRDGKYKGRPDFITENLPAAVEFILGSWPALREQARKAAATVRPGQVVTIGGLARSGKSSLASELQYALRERSIPSVVAPLDSWLHPNFARSPEVLRREMERLETALVRLIVDRATISVPQYGPFEDTTDFGAMVVGPADVIIVDGGSSLVSEKLAALSELRIFVECDEAERRRRLQRDSGSCGSHAVDIDRLHAPLNRACLTKANLVLRSG